MEGGRLKPPLGYASTSRAQAPHRRFVSPSLTWRRYQTRRRRWGRWPPSRAFRFGGDVGERSQTRAEERPYYHDVVGDGVYISLALFLIPLSPTSRFLPLCPLAFTSRCTVSVRLRPSANTKPPWNARAWCRVIVITWMHTCVRSGLRGSRVHACMRACTSGGLMGPANDYWPADLGGTTRARLVYTHLYMRVFVCVYERQSSCCVFTSATWTAGSGFIFCFRSLFSRRTIVFKSENPRLIRKRNETSYPAARFRRLFLGEDHVLSVWRDLKSDHLMEILKIKFPSQV